MNITLREELKSNPVVHFVGKSINYFYKNNVLRIIDYNNYLMRKLGIDKKYSYLKRYKDMYLGKRCFIIATGPSLTYDDLNSLKEEITFSMNSIIKTFPKTEWRPTYYGIQDEFVYEKMIDDINNCGLENIFISDNIKKLYKIPAHSQVFPISFLAQRYVTENQHYFTKFSKDISNQVFAGYSITYSMIQMACYMGFKDIYLLGCDCNYSKDVNKRNFVASGRIDPHYSTAGKRMLIGYNEAKKYADKNNIKIYNATRGGKLEVFERVDLDELLCQNK